MAFEFPGERRAALSISFDDTRLSQADRGLDVLAEHDTKATFYITPAACDKRLDKWRAALKHGHEIANHTVTHPCSCNFKWARNNGLEDYTLERIEGEILGANAYIQKNFGVTPTTYAYPCGHTFVGRGVNLKSYIPIVAKHFVVGRGFKAETGSDPERCDLAQCLAFDIDAMPMERAKKLIDTAIADGTWLNFVGHEIGPDGFQTVNDRILGEMCDYARSRSSELWTDTVANVGAHIAKVRGLKAA